MSTPPICWKCGGSGKLPGYEHIERGVCFACGGSGRAWPRPKPKQDRSELYPWPTAAQAAKIVSGQVEHIKEWLYIAPEALREMGETEEHRWSQVGMAAARTVFDPAMYPKVVKRAFEFARVSKWPDAAAALSAGLYEALGLLAATYRVPPELQPTFGSVPGVYTPGAFQFHGFDDDYVDRVAAWLQGGPPP